MKTLKKRDSLMAAVRAGLVTFFLLSAGFIALLLMGKSFSAMEKTAFGRDTAFLSMPQKDVYLFFGKEYKIPIITTTEKISAFVKLYAPGIIKLLNYTVNAVKESWQSIINML